MAFPYLLPIRLAPTNTGLTLNAILEDATGASLNFADATAEKLTGFNERGNGEYTFYTDQFPDSFPFTCIIRNDADDSFLASASFNEADVYADLVKISGDSAAADSLEAIFNGGGADMSLTGLNVVNPVGDAIQIVSGAGYGVTIDATAVGLYINGTAGGVFANSLNASSADFNGAIDTDTIAQIAAGIWNAILATYSGTAGSTAEALSNAGADAGAIADAVWDETLADHLTAGSTGAALNDAANTNDPAPGAIEFTYTVDDGSNPIDGVEIWITTDSAGDNTVWYGVTDAFGIARDSSGVKPWLDAGTYFFWAQKAGYTFSNPDTEEVS